MSKILIETDVGSLYYPEGDVGITQGMLETGKFETWDKDLLDKLIKPKSVFIDIGAHVGYFSLLALNINCTVYAVEPSSINFDCLKENIGERAHLYNAAAYSETKTGWLYKSSINSGDHRLKIINGNDKEEVKYIRVDDIVTVADVVKIDVQGAEREALKGMTKLIDRCKPVLHIEYSPRHLSQWHEPKELITYIEDLGYQIEIMGSVLPEDDSSSYCTMVAR